MSKLKVFVLIKDGRDEFRYIKDNFQKPEQILYKITKNLNTVLSQ